MRLDPSDLPPAWDAIPPSRTRTAFAGRWLRAAGQLALVLPSGVVPKARNLMLNPLHPAITTVKFGFTGSPCSNWFEAPACCETWSYYIVSAKMLNITKSDGFISNHPPVFNSNYPAGFIS